jgi:hypothetical protein
MSIKDFINKIKPFLPIVIFTLILVDIFGFVYIVLNKPIKEPIKITKSLNSPKTSVFGSKTGKKYYFPWCGGLSRIKPENRVEFENTALAIKAGYSPAKNCKGLQ